MSRDSSATYVHLHSSRLADVFEEFCRPPSSTVFAPNNASGQAPQQATTSGANANNNATQGTLPDGSGMASLPGHYLPFEEIALPAHLMPINPEDEDDVVPDMHAAFGINRALNQNGAASGAVSSGAAGVGGTMGGGEPTGEASHAGITREPVWRDLGLERLVADVRKNGIIGVEQGGMGRRREGRRTGLLLLR